MFARFSEKLQKLKRLDHELARRQMRSVRGAFYSQIWERAAAQMGLSYERLGTNTHRVSDNNASFEFVGSRVPLDAETVTKRIGDKDALYKAYANVGVAPPPYAAFPSSNIQGAADFLESQSYPCVVKPARDTGGGEGVTMGVTNVDQLRSAIDHAGTYAEDLIIEVEIPGDVYRLLYLDGRLLDIVRRDPPRLTGDGPSTIKELVKAENKLRVSAPPFKALSLLTIDEDMVNTLSKAGLDKRSIPASGEPVQVKGACNQNSADENHRYTGALHESTTAAIDTLISHFGVRLVGVDIICHDLSAPMKPDNGYICELNTYPGIHHHYLTADGSEPASIPQQILTALIKRDD